MKPESSSLPVVGARLSLTPLLILTAMVWGFAELRFFVAQSPLALIIVSYIELCEKVLAPTFSPVLQKLWQYHAEISLFSSFELLITVSIEAAHLHKYIGGVRLLSNGTARPMCSFERISMCAYVLVEALDA